MGLTWISLLSSTDLFPYPPTCKVHTAPATKLTILLPMSFMLLQKSTDKYDCVAAVWNDCIRVRIGTHSHFHISLLTFITQSIQLGCIAHFSGLNGHNRSKPTTLCWLFHTKQMAKTWPTYCFSWLMASSTLSSPCFTIIIKAIRSSSPILIADARRS